MSDKDRAKQLDDFWDLSALVPEKKNNISHSKSVEAVEINISSVNSHSQDGKNNEDNRLTYSDRGTISRTLTIDTNSDENAFEAVEKYSLTESPIHTVILNKRRCEYRFYNKFRQDAFRYLNAEATRCEYVPFFSYVPQYDQLSKKQLGYYLWWRECFNKDEYIKTDVSYVLLYVFEIINLGALTDVKRSQYLLVKLWNVYSDQFPSLSAKLSSWICDFSLIHRLPPPKNADKRIVKAERYLKEFYIAMPQNDPQACVSSLIKYCSSYDYHSSKFAAGDNLKLFDTHVFDCLVYIWKKYNGGKGFLEGFSVDDSSMKREAYMGALCCSYEKYRIDIEYSSFSRMNELRYLIGDMIKYIENKIRAAIGVKSRLTVYTSNLEIYQIIDEYFKNYLPTSSRLSGKEKEKHEYDILYDTPKKEFSISEAKKIEEESWDTTNELVTAFEDEEPVLLKVEEAPSAEIETETDVISLKEALGELLAFALAVKDNDIETQNNEARRMGRLKDSIVDSINDISVEMIGDILIEGELGDYGIPECYKEIL